MMATPTPVLIRIIFIITGIVLATMFLVNYLNKEREWKLDSDRRYREAHNLESVDTPDITPTDGAPLERYRRDTWQFEMEQILPSDNSVPIATFLLGLRTSERSVYSTNGEDGVIEAIFDQIGTTDACYVEVNGMNSRTRYLREIKGWQNLLMNEELEDKQINLKKEMIISPSNIVSLFEKYQVPEKFDLLSIDTDFKDWWLLKNILKAGYRPRVIVTRVNSFLPDNEALTMPEEAQEPPWDGRPKYFSFSVPAGWRLSRQFGYSMIYCDVVGVNCFYVIDGEEGLGADLRVSDFYPAIALWRRPLPWNEMNALSGPWTQVNDDDIDN